MVVGSLIFETPHFTFWNTVYTAMGAMVLWHIKGRTNLRAFVVSDIMEAFVKNERLRHFLEFAVFIIFGCLVGVGFTNPHTAPQAFSAGMGWTGLCSSASPRQARKAAKKPTGQNT